MELLAWLLVLLGIILFFGSAAYASFRAAPWLPIRTKDRERIVALVKGRSGTFFELGAGDGRVLSLLVSSTGMHGVGYEISVIPYLFARMRIAKLSSQGKAQVLFKDFFFEDFSKADVIFCFLTPPAMQKLKLKFEKEMRKGTRIISYSFSVPGWEASLVDRAEGRIPIFVYDR